MVTRARFTADLISTVNANTSALANAVHISSSGDVTVANSITVGGNISGYATNNYVYSTFAQNTAIYNLVSDRIQVANAEALYVTKATALSSNNDIVNLTNDTLQVANAAALYVTKAGALTTNNAVVNLIDDRLQVANAAVTYVTKATALTANNTLVNLTTDRLQVANAAVTYVTKATALTSNNALVNLINDRIQVANAGVTYLTKSFALTSNNALVNLINDRIQAANVSTTLGTFWPSANVIAYTNSQVEASSKVVNTSIFIASGGENRVSIPYTNTNFIKVFLNGVLLTEDTDYVAANNVHIGSIDPALVAGDVMVVEEFKNHNANTVNLSAGGGGGGYSFQGSSYGFSAQGVNDGTPYANCSRIERFSFVSDGNSTDVGDDVAPGRNYNGNGGNTSDTSGYTAGGHNAGGTPNSDNNFISKYPFAVDGGLSTDVGDLLSRERGGSGQSSSTSGYYTGGSSGNYPYTRLGCIQKWPFASDTDASGVACLATAKYDIGAGQSSSTAGYAGGGTVDGVGYSNVIDKFPFSAEASATDIGDLSKARNKVVGQSSSEYGYVSGGQPGSGDGPSPYSGNRVDKFSFSSDGNATDVLDLFQENYQGVGHSSTTHGYVSNGTARQAPSLNTNVIQKFPFSSDTNGTDVGDMLSSRYGGFGSQS